MLLVGTLGFVGFGALTWVILLAGVAATHSKLQEFNEDLSAVRSPSEIHLLCHSTFHSAFSLTEQLVLLVAK